jgi:hypothetical protein
MPRRTAILLATTLPFAAGAGCSKGDHVPQPPAPSSPPAASAAPAESASTAAVAAGDAGYAGPWLGATVLSAGVFSDMEFPSDKRESKVVRLGSLRYGEKVPVLPEAHKKPNCPEGWYELLAGGFVCGKYATLDLDHPRFKLAHAPDLEGPLPYDYGYNVANGTPLYRSVPSRAERLKIEPWLVRPKKPKPVDDSSATTLASTSMMALLGDAGAPATETSGGEAESDKPDTPWWQKEVPDGGPPQITLEDLQEASGPVARRMVKGFFLSLDHKFPAAGYQWWKTVAGLVAPFDRVFVSHPATDFHGVWLGKDDGTFPTKTIPARRIDKLPVAFALRGGHHYTLDEKHKHASVTDGAVERFEAIGLTGEVANVAGTEFWETDEGWWMRAIDGTKTEPGPAPDKLGEHDKWIDVNQKRQTLVAFEGSTPVFATLFSSGRNEHETPTGSFRVREKHITATMDGDADTATDGPYSIEDVPYIQYFNGGYALHGAFWHAEFGHVKSHGCVNLAPWDAKNLFGWTDPQLPEGWHAVVATKEHPGTRVVVHERGQGTCQGPKLDVCEQDPTFRR